MHFGYHMNPWYPMCREYQLFLGYLVYIGYHMNLGYPMYTSSTQCIPWLPNVYLMYPRYLGHPMYTFGTLCTSGTR